MRETEIRAMCESMGGSFVWVVDHEGHDRDFATEEAARAYARDLAASERRPVKLEEVAFFDVGALDDGIVIVRSETVAAAPAGTLAFVVNGEDVPAVVVINLRETRQAIAVMLRGWRNDGMGVLRRREGGRRRYQCLQPGGGVTLELDFVTFEAA